MNCNCRPNKLRVTDIQFTAGSEATLIVAGTALVDGDKFCMPYLVDWGPTATGIEVLNIEVFDDGTFPVDKPPKCEAVTIGMLPRCACLCLEFVGATATVPAHFVLLSKTCGQHFRLGAETVAVTPAN